LRYRGPLHIGVERSKYHTKAARLFEAREMKVRNKVTCNRTRVVQDGALVIFLVPGQHCGISFKNTDLELL
jgi:hypothetical protein